MVMKICLFNPKSGDYLGEDFSGEASMKQGGYVISPDAAIIAPSEVERGQVLVFNLDGVCCEVQPVGNMGNKMSAKVRYCHNGSAKRL
jgi:hypothetical protein